MREVMPATAAWVDALRAQFGRECIDALMLAGKRGRRVFYAAEVGPDGVLREFGTAPSGARARVVDGKVVLGGGN
jgi:hypothetical protein